MSIFSKLFGNKKSKKVEKVEVKSDCTCAKNDVTASTVGAVTEAPKVDKVATKATTVKKSTSKKSASTGTKKSTTTKKSTSNSTAAKKTTNKSTSGAKKTTSKAKAE